MQIRKATFNDLEAMQAIFAHARKMMKESGNPTQWKDNRPPLFLIERDLNNNTSYVIENDGKIIATFSFTIGVEPTYVVIKDGKWLNDRPYGTIHRIASDNSVKGIFDYVMNFLKQFDIDIRIDTHKDNKVMLHVLEKNDFKYCGIITIDDGTDRLAFQRLKD